MTLMQKQILIGREFKEGGFKEAYHALPHKLLKQAKIEICNICYWNLNSFNGKLSGKRPFRTYEVEKIEEFFKKYNLNAWTGEPI